MSERVVTSIPNAPERLLVLADPHMATQEISFLRPMSTLGRGRVQLLMPPPSEFVGGEAVRREFWREAEPTVLILSRYADAVALGYQQLARDAGVPCVFHIDDDLLDVPPSIGAAKHAHLSAPERQARLRAVMDHSDLIYASTSALATRLDQHGIRTPVIHGDVYCSAKAPFGPEWPATVPVIGYAATGGHDRDLALVTPALVRLMERWPSLRFECLGTISLPESLLRFGERVQHHPAVERYPDYLDRLRSLGWWIGIAPLVDDAFNRCKADTKWVEYTQAGIAVVASDLPAYSRAGAAGACRLVREPEQWAAELSTLLRSAPARERSIHLARSLLEQHYSHERVALGVLAAVARARELHAQARSRLATAVQAQPAAVTPTRVLFVANALIPTLQLSFLKPLGPDVASGRLFWKLLSGEDLKAQRSALKGQPEAGRIIRDWLVQQIEDFQPNQVVFCRYSDQMADVIVKWARERGIPVMFHVDDDLLNVPKEIGEAKWRMHNAPERLTTVRYLLEHADLSYCSTQALLDRYRALGFKGPMEAGHVYCAAAVINPSQNRPVNKIGYMGFDHAHDFEIVIPALVDLMRRRPEIRFELFGSIPKPPALDEFGDRVTVIPPVRIYADFLQKFASLGWDIGLCPLADTDFNRVKANTKWVEYTSIGAAVIASGDTVYDACAGEGCGKLARSPQEWLKAMESLCDSPTLRHDMVLRAQRRLEAEYSDERLRLQVWRMFERSAALRDSAAG
jgi:hypothetical protein